MELKGKIIDFLGDSITEGCGVSNRAENRYDNVMKKEYGLKEVHNYGIGGTRLAHQSVPSDKPRYDLCFCGRAYDLDPHADVIVVYGGVNDYLHGDAPFGKMGDTTPATFCGAVYFLMTFLKSTYKNAQILFLTPAVSAFQNYATDDTKPSNNPIKRPDAKPAICYVDVILETGKQLGIPVLDLYRNFSVNVHDSEMRAKYTADGLHFNDEAHHILAHTVGEFLKAL